MFELRPIFVRDLEFVDVSYTTGYGEIKSNWRREGNSVEWTFEIPDNSSAWVTLTGSPRKLYGAGRHSIVLENH